MIEEKISADNSVLQRWLHMLRPSDMIIVHKKKILSGIKQLMLKSSCDCLVVYVEITDKFDNKGHYVVEDIRRHNKLVYLDVTPVESAEDLNLGENLVYIDEFRKK